MGDAFDRDLVLAHRFEQCRLGLGRSAVDLVRQDDLRHHRAGPELKVLGLLVKDRDAGNVAGQQVRSELEPSELAAGRYGYRPGQHGLANARDIFDKDVAAAYE